MHPTSPDRPASKRASDDPRSPGRSRSRARGETPKDGWGSAPGTPSREGKGRTAAPSAELPQSRPVTLASAIEQRVSARPPATPGCAHRPRGPPTAAPRTREAQSRTRPMPERRALFLFRCMPTAETPRGGLQRHRNGTETAYSGTAFAFGMPRRVAKNTAYGGEPSRNGLAAVGLLLPG